MPIYEYKCTACGHALDVLQKFSDAPLTDCPECGDAALKKLISAPSFRLKGTGWYETDFKKDKERKRNLAGDSDKPAEKSGGKPDEKSGDKAAGKAAASSGSGDTKPAAKKSGDGPSAGSGT